MAEQPTEFDDPLAGSFFLAFVADSRRRSTTGDDRCGEFSQRLCMGGRPEATNEPHRDHFVRLNAALNGHGCGNRRTEAVVIYTPEALSRSVIGYRGLAAIRSQTHVAYS